MKIKNQSIMTKYVKTYRGHLYLRKNVLLL